MKLLFLPDTADGPVLLFADAYGRAATVLQVAFESLANGQTKSVALHAVSGIEASEGLELIAATGGTSSTGGLKDNSRYRWTLRPLEWETVAALVEPFVTNVAGMQRHQYLGRVGAATVIISTTDQW